jgi:ABC-type uncharacterized transport system auxiliary subunit
MMHTSLARRAFMAASLLALAGCVNLLPNPEAPSALIALPQEGSAAPSAQLQADVSVLPPDAPRAYSGADIAVADGPELVFLSSVRWADIAPRLMQGAVVDALAKAGGPGHATTAQQGVRADYDLRWRIIDLSVSKETGPVNVKVDVSLAESEGRRALAQGTFGATANPASKTQRDRAVALAKAAQDAANQVADFVVKNAKAVPPTGPR